MEHTKLTKIEDGVLTFSDAGRGFRSVRLSAITAVQ